MWEASSGRAAGARTHRRKANSRNDEEESASHSARPSDSLTALVLHRRDPVCQSVTRFAFLAVTSSPLGDVERFVKEPFPFVQADQNRNRRHAVELKFGRYAAVAWLVEAGASNRAGVAWAAVFPVIRARRKAMIMSSTDTCRLCRYHGAAWRRELRSAAGRPARSCHRTRMVRLARPRGVVRSTAAGSRFWASPAPRRSLPSLIDCSTDQREAYLATICPPGVVRSVVARARV